MCYREMDLGNGDLVLVFLQNINDFAADGVLTTHKGAGPAGASIHMPGSPKILRFRDWRKSGSNLSENIGVLPISN